MIEIVSLQELIKIFTETAVNITGLAFDWTIIQNIFSHDDFLNLDHKNFFDNNVGKSNQNMFINCIFGCVADLSRVLIFLDNIKIDNYLDLTNTVISSILYCRRLPVMERINAINRYFPQLELKWVDYSRQIVWDSNFKELSVIDFEIVLRRFNSTKLDITRLIKHLCQQPDADKYYDWIVNQVTTNKNKIDGNNHEMLRRAIQSNNVKIAQFLWQKSKFNVQQ